MQAKAAGVKATQEHDFSAAAREFGRACQLEPKLKDVCYYEGRSLYYANRFEDALAPLQASIDAGESEARATSTMAECLEALGRPAEAERAHRKAIALDSDPEYRVRFAIFLFRQGRIDEAAQPLLEALKVSPNSFDANLELGRVRFEQDKLADALEYLTAALRANPRSAQAHLLAAKVCQRLGRNAEAEQHLKAAQVPEA